MNTTENKVEFDVEAKDGGRKRLLYSRIEPSNMPPAIIKFLIRKHIIKNERQGDILLIVVFLACVIFSVIIIKYSFFTTQAPITKDAVLKILLQK
jgi:hypothetical protein